MTEQKIEAETKEREIFITEKQIQERIVELAQEIREDIDVNNLILVGVLNGAAPFTSDLAKAFDNHNLMLDFISISSYGEGTQTSKLPQIRSDLKNSIQGKDVVIVEDIVDTGYSMAILLEMLRARKPKSLRVCTLLSKPERRELDVPIDYVGFVIENRWVEGYGLDFEERGRCTRDIFQIK